MKDLIVFFTAVSLLSAACVSAAYCPSTDGWEDVGGKCMSCGTGILSHQGARDECARIGGFLSSIKNSDEETFAESCSGNVTTTGVWIGLKRRYDSNLTTSWEDGTTYTAFTGITVANTNGSRCYNIDNADTWDEAASCADMKHFVCSRVDCGTPAAITNGAMYLTTTTYGSIVTYTCNFGYSLGSSSPSRTCQANGTWSGSSSTCSEVTCGSLLNITNGYVSTANGINYGDKATYSCNSGYVVSGTSTRTCLATGSWSSAAPTCDKKDNTLAIALGASLGGVALIALLVAGACFLSRRPRGPPRAPLNPYPRRISARPRAPGRRR